MEHHQKTSFRDVRNEIEELASLIRYEQGCIDGRIVQRARDRIMIPLYIFVGFLLGLLATGTMEMVWRG